MNGNGYVTPLATGEEERENIYIEDQEGLPDGPSTYPYQQYPIASRQPVGTGLSVILKNIITPELNNKIAKY